MAECINIDNTFKGINGEQSILYDKLYMITEDHSSAEDLYKYFYTKEFEGIFGNFQELHDDPDSEITDIQAELFKGRIDENREPALYFDDYFNFYYFLDIYGNRVYYPLQVNKITAFTTEEIKDIVEGIGFDFIKSFEFDEDLVEFINKDNLTLKQFVSDQLDNASIKLQKSDDINKEILGEELEETKDLYLEEWVNKTNSYLKRLKLNLNVKEEYIQKTEENEQKGELIRKESFETDFKDNVNNNIKLMLSIIPSGKTNTLGNSVPLRFEEVYTNLLEKLSPITQLEGEDKFSLFIEEVKKLVKIKPQYKHLIQPTEENNYLPLFSKERSETFKRQIINAFDLVKKNHLQSEIENKDGKTIHTFKNISETSNRKNIALREWDSNLRKKDLKNSELNRFSRAIIKPFITSINKNKDKYNSIDKFILDYNYKITEIFDKLGIEYSKPSLKYFLNNNSLEELNIESNISKYVKLLNDLTYFIKNKAESFKDQSSIVELAEAHAFFQERTSDSSVNTMGKNKWVYGNRTYLETNINQWIKNPEILEAKLNEDSTVQSGSAYIPYLLGYVNKQGRDEGIESKEERHKLASKRLEDLKVFYFNGIQAKGDNKNSSDSKNVSRADIILDNVNKLLSFKVGQNPTSKTSLASDKSSAIELQYNYSINADLKVINGKNSYSNQTIQTIFKYIDAEYKRIGKTAEEIETLSEEELVSSYHTGPKNGLKFFTIKELNDPSKIGLDLFDKDGKPIFKSLADNNAVKERIDEFISESITKEIENIKEKLIENRILKRDIDGNIINNLINNSIYKYYIEEKGSNAIDSLIADYFVNSYVSQVEYHNLFTGDMAYYKNPVDYIKRVSSSYTDGQYLSNFDKEIYYNIAVAESVEIDPINIEKIKNKEIRELYRNANAADAQAWITPRRWKFIKQGLGKWTSIDEDIWKKMHDKNAEFTNSELKKLAQPLKGVHFELKDGKRPIYLKYSQAVLVPSIIKNMPELQAIYDRMTKPNNRIDELLTKDAIKVGSNKISKIHNSEGGVINLDQLETTQLQNKFWKLQQDLPTKGFKELKLGSQIKEIMLQGLIAASDKTEFTLPGTDETYNKDEFLGIVDGILAQKSNLGTNKLKNLLGLDDNFKIQNKELLYKKIINQLEQRDTDQNTLDALQMGISPYGIPGSAELFQNVFSTLINSEIVDIKTNGGSFVQMSDFGFNFSQLSEKNKNNGITLTPAGQKAIANKESKLHMPEEYKDENGKKRVRPGGVFLSGNLLAKHIPNYNQYTTEELFGKNGLVDSEILDSIIGYRIPNQSLASNDAFEVLGFLPETMADTVVPYTGFTTKTGSDFDIDKLYLMIPSFRVEHSTKTIQTIKNKIRQQSSLEELKEELLNQGYTKNSLKKKSDVYNYFVEDILLLERHIYDENLKTKYENILEGIDERKSKLKYIKPLSVEDLKEGNINDNPYYEQSLNNLLLNSYKSILTNPDVYNEMINPIDIPFMQENIESLAPPQEREGMNYFNSFEDAYTRLEYMEGKKGLGIIINQMMDSIRGSFNPVSHDLNIKNANNILDNAKSKELTKEDIDEYTTFYNKFVREFNKNNPEAKPKKELTQAEIKKIKSLSLKDSMTALVNAFVDIAKDPYVFRGNWNTTTTNLGSMLLRMGMHPFIVNSFLSNKTIKDYIEFSNLNDSVTNTGSKNNFLKYILTKKIEEASSEKENVIKIKDKELDITNLLKDLILKGSGPVKDLEMNSRQLGKNIHRFIEENRDSIENDYKDNKFIIDNLNQIIGEAAYLLRKKVENIRPFHNRHVKRSLQQGNKYLNLKDLLSELNSDTNYDILYLYDKLQNMSDKLSLNVKSNSYRVNGKGKNITSTFVGKNLVLKAADKTNFYTPFQNYIQRFDEVEGFQNNLKTLFNNSIEFPIKIMQNNPQLFIAGSKSASKTFNLISKLSSDNGLLTNQDLADRLERSYLAYIMSGFKPFKENNPSKFIDNFNKKFIKIKENEKISKNKLIKELDIKDEVIQASGTKKLTHYKNELTDAWKELEEQFPEFSKELAKYSYLTSGFFTGPTTFFQFIPVGFYNKNYFNAYLNKINNKLNNFENDNKGEYDFNFIKQFAQNNFDLSNITGKNKLIYPGKINYIGHKKTGLVISDVKEKRGIVNIYNYNIDNISSHSFNTKFIKFINSLQKKEDKNSIFEESNLTNEPLFSDSQYVDITQPQEKPEVLPEYQEEVNEDIDYIFKEYPELNKIGTKEEYSNYLDTIFPNSKVKDIVYHGSHKKFETFSKEEPSKTQYTSLLPGFYFTNKKYVANAYTESKEISIINNLTRIKQAIERKGGYYDYLVEDTTQSLDENSFQETMINALKSEGYRGDFLKEANKDLTNLTNLEKYIDYFNVEYFSVSYNVSSLLNNNEKILVLKALLTEDSKIISDIISQHENIDNPTLYSVILNAKTPTVRVNEKINPTVIKNFDLTLNKNSDSLILKNIRELPSYTRNKLFKNLKYEDKVENTLIVFKPEQIHILGSKQDIKGFKEFIKTDNKKEEETLQDNIKPIVDTTAKWSKLKNQKVYTEQGVNTMRTSNKEIAHAHFGNPFSEGGYSGTIKMPTVESAVQAYKDWLMTNKYENVKPKQKEWILDQIKDKKLDNATLLYDDKLASRGKGTHADALAEIVKELRNNQPTPTTKKEGDIKNYKVKETLINKDQNILERNNNCK